MFDDSIEVRRHQTAERLAPSETLAADRSEKRHLWRSTEKRRDGWTERFECI